MNCLPTIMEIEMRVLICCRPKGGLKEKSTPIFKHSY